MVVTYNRQCFCGKRNATMAASTHSPISTVLSHSSMAPSNPTKLTLLSSSLSPSKLTKRKNYLRPKILKTLTKPHPSLCPQNPFTPINPIEPFGEPSSGFIEKSVAVDECDLEPKWGKPSSNLIGEFEKPVGVSECDSGSVRVSDGCGGVVEGSNIGIGSLCSGEIVRLVVSLVGLFVIRTIIAVWVLGSGDSVEKDRNLRVEDGHMVSKSGSRQRDVGAKFEVKTEGFVYVDDSETEAKIAEIREMAREAREIEKKKLDADNNGSLSDLDSDDDSSGVRIEIQKEVEGKLKKLRKSLSSTREKSPLLNVNYLNEVGQSVEKAKVGELDGKREDDMLVFEKRYRLRNQLGMVREKPKGFQGYGNGVGLREQPSTIDKEHPLEGAGTRSQAGIVQDDTDSNRFDEGAKSRKPNSLLSRHSQSEMKYWDASTKSKKPDLSLRNGSSRISKVESKRSSSTRRNKHINGDSELWWLKLPYVLVILMQKGTDTEGQQGFYTLKVPSDERNQIQTSYTVAFEDSAEAKNFCYVLESFFEDLEDASIDIVPLSIKEFTDMVKSERMKVIVVKKGQLQLYAGQPLSDVEAVLLSLVS